MTNFNFEDLSIIKFLETVNKKYDGRTALQIKTEAGTFRKLTFSELGKQAVNVSSALIKLGVKKGEKVAIISENRPAWAVACFGTILASGVVVPVDVKLSEKEVQFILNHSETKCVFVSGKYLDVIETLRSVLPYLEHVILLDDIKHHDEILMKDLKAQKQEEKKRPIYPEDTALLVYTSGTTGVAKGIELTYKNFLFQVHALDEMIKYSDSDRFLSILPLNHTLEITGGLIAPLFAGACITYSDSLKPDKLIALMKETKTTVMISVPLVLKMIHDAIMKKAGKLSPPKRKMFIFLLKTSRFMMSINRGIGKVFFRSVHDEFGGHLRGFITGGAPLNKEVEININALGFRVLQGYGLTETAPVISVNTLKYNRIGSAGKAIPGVEVKVVKKSKTDPTGEIATKGPHMMRGYYKDPDKTKEVIKDGWLHTGDIGHVDRRGYLYISGRERNLIVLGSGKKVFPEEVEAVIEKSPYIKEICVLARISTKGRKAGTEEVYAVIVPELDVFTPAEKYDKLSIKERLKQELSRLSKELASYKRISAFEVWEDELPKTASRKIKRKAVEEKVGITGRMIK